ncbi:MAG: DUF559 domain-containing protein [bacterium]
MNDLYIGTDIEEKMWHQIKKNEIQAEREFFVKVENKYFFLDFALFCQSGKIDVECDGDANHKKSDDVEYDKDRDTLLESDGWKTMRFTSTKINDKIDESIIRIKKAVDNFGGLQVIREGTSYKYLIKNMDSQLNLFESK